MPAPHPLASLYAAGPPYTEAAKAQLAALLAAHGGDVRATAAALRPPIHETTLHDWLTRWGMRGGVIVVEPSQKRSGRPK